MRGDTSRRSGRPALAPASAARRFAHRWRTGLAHVAKRTDPFPGGRKQVAGLLLDHVPVDADPSVVMPAALLEDLSALRIREVRTQRLHVVDGPERCDMPAPLQQIADRYDVQFAVFVGGSVEPLPNRTQRLVDMAVPFLGRRDLVV